MNPIKILLFLSISAHAHSNGCKSFISDSNKVNDSAGILEEEVPLICGIREGHIHLQTNIANESMEDDMIKWNEEAICVDDHTIFLTMSNQKQKRNTFENVDYQAYLAILCFGHAQINVTYEGILPTTGNILTSRVMDNQRYFTALYIPYQTTKSGNYTFQLTTLQSSRWFFVIFDSDLSDFWKPSESDLDLESYEDPYDSRMIIIPCQISGRRNVNLALTHPSLKRAYKPVKSIPFKGHQIYYWDQSLYKYQATKGIVVPKEQLLQLVNSILPGQGYATADHFVNCVNLNEPSSKRMIRINFNKKPTTKDLHYSSRFKLEFFNQTLSCSSNYSAIYVSNIYFTSSSEWRFLSKCALKNNTCPWNSYYSDNGTVIKQRDDMKNKKMNHSKGNFCPVAGIFKSGMVRCSTDDEREDVELLYFTGLDNKIYTFPPAKDLPTDALVSVSPINTTNLKVYANESITLTCKLVYYALLPTFQWNVELNNGTVTSLDHTSLSDNRPFLTIIKDEDNNIGIAENKVETIIPADAKAVLCRSVLRDTDNNYVESRIPIYVKYAPEILKNLVLPQENGNNLTCWIRGEPTPSVKWLFNGEEIPTTNYIAERNGTNFSVVTVSKQFGRFPNGNYTCVAKNSVGEDSFAVLLGNQETTTNSRLEIILYTSLGVCALASILIAIIYLIRRKRKVVMRNKEINAFMNGKAQTELPGESNNFTCWQFDKEMGVNLNDFCIDTDGILSSSSNRMVLMATVKGVRVVARTVKSKYNRHALLDLLEEIKILSSLNEHPCILTFIGAHTAKLPRGELYLFVEYCQMGSVEAHLREKACFLLDSNSSMSIEDEWNLVKNLLNWSLQTASAMKYLAECKVIHGDLAAKNLLLKDLNTLKITDFGLSRRFLNYTLCTKSKQIVPWRHMSPEVLSQLDFSFKSDVWAFGVTLWEMFSLGELPYSKHPQWTVGFVSYLEGGFRLKKPSLCISEMFTLMERCWEFNPQGRPNFEELYSSLQHIFRISKERQQRLTVMN